MKFINHKPLTAALVAVATMLGSASVIAQDLKLAWLTADSKTDPYAITAHAFKDALERRLPNGIMVNLFPNRQLGDDKEILEGLKFGTIDLGIITNAVVANVEPTYQLMDLPFLFGNSEQAHRFLDGDIGTQLKNNLLDNGIYSLGIAEGGFRNMINSVRPVYSPADIVGVKYRTMQSPVFIEMFNSLGGSPVPMAWGETFTAMQQGTIDGLEIPSAVVKSNNYADVAKYLSQTRHTYSAIHLLMSKKKYDKLTPDVKQAINEAGIEAVNTQREAVAILEQKVLNDLQEAGMKVNEINDPAEFRALVAPVYKKFEASIGSELLNSALKQVSSN
jgi:tripartite ATP-independent transporter DctP family solute receptor